MDILKMLLSSSLGDSAISAMSQKSGLDPQSVEAVVSKIAPIFMQKISENFKSDSDSSNLIGMIRDSNLEQISSDPQSFDIAGGNDLLGILTGSKENSSALADDVGSKLGIDVGSIKTLLPMIAPLVVGMLKKQVGGVNLSNLSDVGSLMPLITNFVDQNKDGSIMDDALKIAGNFFGKK